MDQSSQPQGLARECQAEHGLSLSTAAPQGTFYNFTLFCVACLMEHPQQFQDYISLSPLFARDVSQALKSTAQLLRAFCFTRRHTQP